MSKHCIKHEIRSMALKNEVKGQTSFSISIGIDGIPADPASFAAIQIIELLHIFLVQLKVVYLCIRVYAQRGGALWKGDEARIQRDIVSCNPSHIIIVGRRKRRTRVEETSE